MNNQWYYLARRNGGSPVTYNEMCKAAREFSAISFDVQNCLGWNNQPSVFCFLGNEVTKLQFSDRFDDGYIVSTVWSNFEPSDSMVCLMPQWVDIVTDYYQEKIELAKQASDRYGKEYGILSDYESHQDQIEGELTEYGATNQWITDNTDTIKNFWEGLTDHDLV
jgi:hypothetical protein